MGGRERRPKEESKKVKGWAKKGKEERKDRREKGRREGRKGKPTDSNVLLKSYTDWKT